MNWELVTAVIFYSSLALIVYLNRSKIEIIDKIFFAYRWKKAVEYIKKLSKFTFLFKVLSTISIPVCIFFMIFGIDLLIQSANTIIASPAPQAGVTLLIPGVKMPGSDLYVPFWYGIISIIIIAFVHEVSHGITSVVEKVKLKSAGVGVALLFPVAFVEPDEKSLLKSSRLSRLRVYAAGSFANIVLAFLAFLLTVNVLAPIVDSEVDYTSVISSVPNMPAYNAGLPNNTYLETLNNKSISNITEFYQALLTVAPYENITLKANGTTYELTTTANPTNSSIAYLGVTVEQGWEFKESLQAWPEWVLMVPFFLFNLFVWISNLNFSVGIFNLIPLWITDGGKIVFEVLSTIIPRKVLFFVLNYVFILVLGLLLFNIFGPAIMSIF